LPKAKKQVIGRFSAGTLRGYRLRQNYINMPQFAVCHITKGSGNGSALGNHIDRIETKNLVGELKNNFNNADPNRRHLNKEFAQDKFKNLSLAKAVSLRILEGYDSRTKAGELKQIAKGAVKFVELNLSGSHERMKEIEADPKLLNAWVNENLNFAKERYGANNIVRFTLHLDETTPHIHCVFVPLTSDGRLTAKEIVGNNKALKNLQDDYAAAMKSFGLERGIEGSQAHHTGKTEYLSKQNLAIKEVDKLIVEKKAFNVSLGIDKDKTIENLKTALIQYKTALKMVETIKSDLTKSNLILKNENESFKNQVLKLTESLKEKEKELSEEKYRGNNNLRRMIKDPAFYEMINTKVFEIDEREKERKLLLERQKAESEKRIEKAVSYHLNNQYLGKIPNIKFRPEPLNKALQKELGFQLTPIEIEKVYKKTEEISKTQNKGYKMG